MNLRSAIYFLLPTVLMPVMPVQVMAASVARTVRTSYLEDHGIFTNPERGFWPPTSTPSALPVSNPCPVSSITGAWSSPPPIPMNPNSDDTWRNWDRCSLVRLQRSGKLPTNTMRKV
jgi:hypothetical protein